MIYYYHLIKKNSFVSLLSFYKIKKKKNIYIYIYYKTSKFVKFRKVGGISILFPSIFLLYI